MPLEPYSRCLRSSTNVGQSVYVVYTSVPATSTVNIAIATMDVHIIYDKIIIKQSQPATSHPPAMLVKLIFVAFRPLSPVAISTVPECRIRTSTFESASQRTHTHTHTHRPDWMGIRFYWFSLQSITTTSNRTSLNAVWFRHQVLR